MARLHGDGFDHYGTDVSNMLDGVYAQASGVALTTAQAATGAYSVFVDSKSGLSNFAGLRKVLPAAKDKMGAIGRFYFPTLPTSIDNCYIFIFHSPSPNTAQVSAQIDANGAIRFYRGGSFGVIDGPGTLIAQSDPIVVASAWNHIEVQVYIHDTLGWVRVAVNGVHKYQATGLDTNATAGNIASVGQLKERYNVSGGVAFYMDDYALYDFTGNPAVDTDWCPTVDGAGVATSYIGQLGAYIGTPDADTAQAAWLRSAGGAPSYPFIGKTTPNDATWLYATAAAQLSEFGFTDLPPEITYIRGVDIYSRMWTSDAGAAEYRSGMKSVAANYDAPAIPITVEPTYWVAQVNVDPNTGVRWTRPSYNAAWLRMTRSA